MSHICKDISEHDGYKNAFKNASIRSKSCKTKLRVYLYTICLQLKGDSRELLARLCLGFPLDVITNRDSCNFLSRVELFLCFLEGPYGPDPNSTPNLPQNKTETSIFIICLKNHAENRAS